MRTAASRRAALTDDFPVFHYHGAHRRIGKGRSFDGIRQRDRTAHEFGIGF
jgi:hypothetical protein